MNKRRILFCGEASFLSTGFSTYTNELLQRLYKTGKFEIAEFGSYAQDGDPRINEIPWKFYPVQPNKDDQIGNQAFNSKQTNQFGEWRFTDVVLDFKPDIVFDHRDWWMSEFQARSPFRPFFHWAIMPTVDGEPQRDKWLKTYQGADSVHCYSEYGYNLLTQQGNKKIPLCGLASPSADINIFKPVEDKQKHKEAMGFEGKTYIIGMVARNQKRKLYGDLLDTFRLTLDKLVQNKKQDIANKTFLYLHTSYPDVGYDLWKFIQKNHLSNKVLITYYCPIRQAPGGQQGCGLVFPLFFSKEVTFCPRCKAFGAHPPHSNSHVSRVQLAQIYNLFDIYVQYSICEGFGMPVLEAKACGVPTLVVDYSAMEDHANSPGGIPIRVQRYFYEPVIETEQKRALPDNEDCASKLYQLLKKGSKELNRLGQQARNYVTEDMDDFNLPRHSWDRIAKIWENHFDTCEIPDREQTWESTKPKLVHPNLSIPQNLNNEEFVTWCIENILQHANRYNSIELHEFVQALNCGYKIQGPDIPGLHSIKNRQPVNREGLTQYFVNVVSEYNTAEMRRTQVAQPDQLQYQVV